MSNRMSDELERLFLIALEKSQKIGKAYWVQAKWIAIDLFGYSLTDKEFRTKKTRVYRLGKRLLKKGLVEITKKRVQVGKSSGRSQVIYYHKVM